MWLAVLLGGTLLVAGCHGGDGEKLSLPLERSAEARHMPPAQGSPPPGKVAPVLPAAREAEPEEPVPASPPLTGTLEAHRRATVAPRATATIARVHVREGDRVDAGAPLVTLDTSDMELQVAQAQAMLDAAKVQYEQAAADWQRTAKLAETQQVSPATLEMAETRMKAMKASKAQAEVALSMARKAVSDAVIRAPFAGLVTKKFVSEGERVATMPPAMLVTIEEDRLVDLRIQVPEMDMEKVHPGDGILVQVSATGKSFPAKITRVISSIDPRTRTFAAIAELPNEKYELRPGMFVEVRFDGSLQEAATR